MKSGIPLLVGLLVIVTSACGGRRQKELLLDVDIKSLEYAVRVYFETTGLMPTSEEGLTALVERPGGLEPAREWVAILKVVPEDPWGMEYVYQRRELAGATAYSLWSFGQDRKPSGDDRVFELDAKQSEVAGAKVEQDR
ncbi:MAG: type II secretion system protein GspG [Akkermansiaceae bacterium]|nr:type II secretion system protein GspG [Akkermansiaceae bacterium]MCP5546202.1 type II secretion system protein GspG [Akkermansiaceae bacterium]